MNYFKIAKTVVAVSYIALSIKTVIGLERQRAQAVSEVNTLSAMFGSLANFVGEEQLAAWHDNFAHLQAVDFDEEVLVEEEDVQP